MLKNKCSIKLIAVFFICDLIFMLIEMLTRFPLFYAVPLSELFKIEFYTVMLLSVHTFLILFTRNNYCLLIVWLSNIIRYILTLILALSLSTSFIFNFVLNLDFLNSLIFMTHIFFILTNSIYSFAIGSQILIIIFYLLTKKLKIG